MASATWRSSNSNAPYVVLYLTQDSQSVNDNTSRLLYELILYRPSSVSSGASKSYSIYVNGSKVASGTTTIGGSGRKEIKTGYVTVGHNSDGTKTVSFSFSLQIDITFSGSWIGTVSASSSTSLTTIPRKSSLSVSNGTLNSTLSIGINRASSSFTHRITYDCGSYHDTIVERTSSTSVSWTPPLSLANTNTTGISVSVTLNLATYNGSTYLGYVSKTISCAIPSSVVPSITSISTGSDPTEHLTNYAAYVKNKTKATFSISASTAYGSAISNYKVALNGVTYSSSSNSITTNVLTNSGSLTATITITDKRGRTASTSRTLTVLDYTTPEIETMQLVRCDENGIETNADTATHCKLTYKFVTTALNNHNNVSYSYAYKKTTDANYTTVAITFNSYTQEGFVVFAAAADYSYNVRLIAEDDFTTVAKATNLSSATTIMNWLANGLGMAIGKVAELSGFLEIGYKTMFKDEIFFDTYSDDEKNFYFENNAARENRTYENDGIYPHNCKFYGGGGQSLVGIGCYDIMNSKRIWAYLDTSKNLRTGVPLFFNDRDTFEHNALPNNSIFNVSSGYTCVEGNIYKWGPVVMFFINMRSTSDIGSGNIANIHLGTLIDKYRPLYIFSLSSGNIGPICVGQVNMDGKVYLAATHSGISASSSGSSFCLSGMWLSSFTT